MSHSDNNEISAPLSRQAIAQGYGRFPYIIVRMHYAVYMQMPIHFVAGPIPGKKGILVQTNKETREENYQHLIDVTSRYKNNLDNKSNRNHRLCVVVGKDQAYYFEEDKIRFNASIPFGGTLVNSDQQVIGMGHEHFIQQ